MSESQWRQYDDNAFVEDLCNALKRRVRPDEQPELAVRVSGNGGAVAAAANDLDVWGVGGIVAGLAVGYGSGKRSREPILVWPASTANIDVQMRNPFVTTTVRSG